MSARTGFILSFICTLRSAALQLAVFPAVGCVDPWLQFWSPVAFTFYFATFHMLPRLRRMPALPLDTPQAFDRVEVLVQTDNRKPVLFCQGGYPAIVGWDGLAVRLKLPAYFGVEGQRGAVEVQDFRVTEESIEPCLQSDAVAGLPDAEEIFAQADHRDANTRGTA